MTQVLTVFVALVFLAALFFCIRRIVLSIFAESKYRAVLSQNSPYSSINNEPFCGSLFLCALLVYIYQNAYDAERGMRYSFGKLYRADWGTACRAAESLHSALNGDLLVESLASALSHGSLDEKLLALIFSTLISAEVVWNEKDCGSKPSAYLARLLDYTIENSELAQAYGVLGLSVDASLSEVKAAHRRLAAKYHPDSTAAKKTSSSAATELEAFMKIQKAYEFILKELGTQ